MPARYGAGAPRIVVAARCGFSLVETLLATALLALVLVPLLGLFRAQLVAAGEMRLRLQLERAVAMRLNQVELAGSMAALPPFAGAALRLPGTVERREVTETLGIYEAATLTRYSIELREPQRGVAATGERLILESWKKPPEETP